MFIFKKQGLITSCYREKPIPAGNFPKDSVVVGLLPGADLKCCVWGSRNLLVGILRGNNHENTSEKQNNSDTRKSEAKLKAQNS